jgi:hypothetical protein
MPDEFLNIFTTAFPQWAWLATMPTSVHTLPQRPLLLTQGSTKFLSTLPSALFTLDSIISLEGNQSWQPPPSWYSGAFSLADYGGILHGPWVFFSNKPIPSTLALTSPCLTTLHLHHFIDSTIRGGTDTPPEAGPASNMSIFNFPKWIPALSCLNQQGFLSRESPRDLVLCPSIFSPSRWVIRPLSIRELGAIYNVP